MMGTYVLVKDMNSSTVILYMEKGSTRLCVNYSETSLLSLPRKLLEEY